MNQIDDALKELSVMHAKYQLPGRFLASGNASALWPIELPRSAEIDFYYNNYEPKGIKIETGLTPLKLFELGDLKKKQIGYRWVNTVDGVVLDDEWPASNLVIMDDSGGGKPIIAITDVANTPIFASYDVVQPFQISDSLVDFIGALSKLIDIVYGEFNVFDLSDDEGISDAFLARLLEEVEPILGEDNTSRFIDYFYG